MTPLELLIKTRKRIETPDRWAKGQYRDDQPNGKVCLTEALFESAANPELVVNAHRFGPLAVRMRMFGASMSAMKTTDMEFAMMELLLSLALLMPEYPTSGIESFNDHPHVQHKDVLRLLDLTIVRLQEYENSIKAERMQPSAVLTNVSELVPEPELVGVG